MLWRYEREEQFALIRLLKTIAYALPINDEYKGIKEELKKRVQHWTNKRLPKAPRILMFQREEEVCPQEAVYILFPIWQCGSIM